MRHSRAVKSAEFEPCIASEKSKTVICAHYKAGLREALSVLFLLIAYSDVILEASCTSQPISGYDHHCGLSSTRL